jgi:hypothetical protein
MKYYFNLTNYVQLANFCQTGFTKISACPPINSSSGRILDFFCP